MKKIVIVCLAIGILVSCKKLEDYNLSQAKLTLDVSDSTSCAASTKIFGFCDSGKVLTAENKVMLLVKVLTPGVYSIATDTVNGISFSKNNVTFRDAYRQNPANIEDPSNHGYDTVYLRGIGKPLAVGRDTFMVKVDNKHCSFIIRVRAVGDTTTK